MLKARMAVQKLKEYHPPLEGRTGLRLDFNENTSGPSARVFAKLQAVDLDGLSRYPERAPVERLTATFLGLKAQQALLTNGVDEAIQLICQTYLDPGDEALVVVPTFAMYELLAASTGANVISVPMLDGFRFPLDDLLGSIRPATRMIMIANPNNPTGAVVSSADILKVARAAPDAAVFVDEAYFEFYGQTVLPEIGNSPNLLMARTFSKAYGLAGLRIGILAGDEAQIQMVRKVASPYNVNGVALACMTEALEDRGFVNEYAAETRRGRELLENTLGELGIRYWPSQANFVLAYFGSHAQEFVAEMASRGILVRDRSGDHGCKGCVRISIGTAEQMKTLLATLREIVRSLGMRERSLV